MVQAQSKFQQELARGRAYEVAVTRWLQDCGYYTLPVFDFNGLGDGFAPHLDGLQADGTPVQLIAPDILACKDGVWTWFEVKLKEQADLHRVSSTLVTGLPLRNWEHYQAVQQATRTSVLIVFVHLAEGEVRAGNISAMTPHHIHSGSTMDRGGTIFFTYTTLKRVLWLKDLDKYKEALP